MAKTFGKLTRRGIKSSISRFLSILGIVAIGAGFLAGLMATSPNMKDNAILFYAAHNTYDIQIQCNLGLTDKDLDAVKNLDSVQQAQAINMNDVQMVSNDENYVTRIFGVDFENQKERINSFELTSGRLPQKENECVVEIPNAYGVQPKIGEKLAISTANDEYKTVKKDYKYEEYTITGIVKSPLFVSMSGETTTVGDGTVALAMYIGKDVCKQKTYSTIYATVKSTKGMDPFSDEYKDALKKETKDLKTFGKIAAKERHDDIVNDAKAEIKKAENKYKKNKDKADEKLAAAYREIQRGKAQINSSEEQILSQEKKLNDSEAELNRQEKKLDAVESDINKAKALLEKGVPLPESTIKQIRAYDRGRAAIADGRKQIKTGRAQLESGRAQIVSAKAELEKGQKEYEKSKKKVDEKFAAGKKKINKAKASVKDIDAGKWYVTDRNDNYGISSYSGDIDKVAAVATVFPIFFFLIAALVALTTMTRMIEEERMQIGTLKSLGYSNWEILKYYLEYSLWASLGGAIIGEIIGFAVLPRVISNAYSMAYNFNSVSGHVIWPLALGIGGIIIICILLTTYFACRHELKEKPAGLMLPRAPQMGKRILLERITPLWRKLKFTRKVTLRNLFRYKKRFLMTIIGVAGCVALLIAGFGVRDSIGDIVGLQYGELNRYDITGQANSQEDIEGKELQSLLNNKEDIDKWCQTAEKNVDVKAGGEKQEATLTVAKNTGELKEFINFRDRKTGDPINFNENSVLVTEKMAEVLKVSVGDKIQVDIKNGNAKAMKVTGIVENYVLNKIYVGKAAFNETFDSNLEYNSLIIKKAKGISSEELSTKLLDNKDISYIISSDTVKKNFEDSVGSIDYIVIVLIAAAGALAMVVLYNLTNVNVCERKKELATIKVLGFYEREVSTYIFREINILSALGMIVGIPAGIALHAFVIKTAEVDAVMFGREVKFLSFVFSFAITAFFTFLVNLIMRKSIKRIDMVESMKAND